MREIREYVKMTLPEIEELDRGKTIFLMAVSPIEGHGPHLPVGTDVIISGEILKRYAGALREEYPDYVLVALPPLYLGADALPVKGSISVPAPYLKGVLLSYVRGLSAQGFRYLFLADNHGGPRHQMAMEIAARKAWRKHRFCLVNPFNLEFRLMVQHDPQFLAETGLEPGRCGDDADSHAGTNETSLMLAAAPAEVRAGWTEVSPSLAPAPARPVALASRLARVFSRTLSRDLEHLANTMAWVGDPAMLPYMGAPGLASPEAGEAMLQARVKVAMDLFRKALSGEQAALKPLLWGVRILHRLPE